MYINVESSFGNTAKLQICVEADLWDRLSERLYLSQTLAADKFDVENAILLSVVGYGKRFLQACTQISRIDHRTRSHRVEVRLETVNLHAYRARAQ